MPIRSRPKLAQRLRLGITFEAIACAWHEHGKGARSEDHTRYVLHRIETDVFPDLGCGPISEITTPQLLAVAKRIESRDALQPAPPHAANLRAGVPLRRGPRHHRTQSGGGREVR